MIRDEATKTRQTMRDSIFKRRENFGVLSIFVGFIIVIVIWQLIRFGAGSLPTFITPVNILNIVQQVAAPGIIAVGMTIVMISGGIDLSVGMLASLASIVVALGVTYWHLGVVLSIILGIVSAVALEACMGFIISRTRVEPFIITLGGMTLSQGVALLLCNSQEVDIHGELDFLTVNLIKGAKDPTTGLNLIFQPYALLFFAILAAGWAVLKYTKYGRRIYAVGANPQAAYLAGINVKNMKLSVYMITGVLVAIGATVLLGRINTGIITLGQGLELQTIAMVVVGGTALAGGKGNMIGTLIGVLFLGSIGNAMALLRMPAEAQYVASGLVLIIAVSSGDFSSQLTEFFSRRKAMAVVQTKHQLEKGGDGNSDSHVSD